MCGKKFQLYDKHISIIGKAIKDKEENIKIAVEEDLLEEDKNDETSTLLLDDEVLLLDDDDEPPEDEDDDENSTIAKKNKAVDDDEKNIVIKFNPNKYEDGKNPMLYKRLPDLEKEIARQFERIVNSDV